MTIKRICWNCVHYKTGKMCCDEAFGGHQMPSMSCCFVRTRLYDYRRHWLQLGRTASAPFRESAKKRPHQLQERQPPTASPKAEEAMVPMTGGPGCFNCKTETKPVVIEMHQQRRVKDGGIVTEARTKKVELKKFRVYKCPTCDRVIVYSVSQHTYYPCGKVCQNDLHQAIGAAYKVEHPGLRRTSVFRLTFPRTHESLTQTR